MPRPLSEQVVVVTGASSGIGRETSVAFGRAGAAVVLAARSEAALHDVAREVEAAGGQALVVPTDVSDAAAVNQLGAAAVARFGRIDTWVNDASIAEYANTWETTPEEMARIVAVNLLGVMYGSRVAIPLMAVEGEGVIINVGSVVSKRSAPLLGAYSAAKAGVKGFTDALHLELKRDYPGISAVLIMPSAINTPFFEHARSKMGTLPRPLPPVYEPAAVAEAILHTAEHPVAQVVVGGGGKVFTMLERVSPALANRMMRVGGAAWKLQQSGLPDDGVDNLFAPSGGGPARGPWGEMAMPSSGYTRHLELHPERKALLGAVLVVGAALLMAGRRR